MTDEEILRLLRDHAYGALFHDFPDPMIAYDITGRVLDANDALRDRIGMSLAEYAAYPFASFVVEDKREQVRAEFALSIASGPRTLDTEALLPNGVRLGVRITLVPFEHEGAVVAVIAASRNLRELEVAQSERAAIEEQFTSVLNSISDGFFILDKDWVVRYVNPRGEAITQRPASEILGKSVWDEFPGLFGSEFGIAGRRARDEGTSTSARAEFGDLGWFEVSMHNLADQDMAVYARDVSGEEVARRDLELSQRRLAAQAALLDVAHDAIIVCDLDNRIRYWNKAASRIYGWSSAEIVGSSLRQLLYRDADQFDQATARTIGDGHWTGELSGATKAGSTIIAESSWTLVRDEAGQPESILSVSTNITERRRQEAIMMRTQRLDSLGTFASGIAHDLNNVLTPILMSAQVLAYDESDPRRRQMLDAIETGASRGADMIRQVLSFARGVETRRYRVDITRLMQEFGELCRSSFPASIQITSDVAPEPLFVAGDPTQLMQLLLNLAGNARDAMPDGGRLLLSARAEYLSEAVAASAGTSGGPYVVIDVGDSGSGMSTETVGRIFEPFFTTKAAGDGTGIGLATSAAIVRSHSGFIQVSSSIGRGSRFRVNLPVSTDNLDATPVEPTLGEHLPLRGSGELVLIVDDETGIRTAATHALESFGYSTAVCANAADALEYLAQETRAVSLILTDVTMPGMSGVEFASRLEREGSTIPVIAMSGLADPTVADADHSGIIAVLAKPFTTGDLLRVVHDAIPHSDPVPSV